MNSASTATIAAPINPERLSSYLAATGDDLDKALASA
jgi:hypothetical protein